MRIKAYINLFKNTVIIFSSFIFLVAFISGIYYFQQYNSINFVFIFYAVRSLLGDNLIYALFIPSKSTIFGYSQLILLPFYVAFVFYIIANVFNISIAKKTKEKESLQAKNIIIEFFLFIIGLFVFSIMIYQYISNVFIQLLFISGIDLII